MATELENLSSAPMSASILCMCALARSVLASSPSRDPQRIPDKDHYGLEKSKSASSSTWLYIPASTKMKSADPLLGRRPPASARPRSASRFARATNRKFVRMSLGGVARRGRKSAGSPHPTIGSMPGQDPAEHVEGAGEEPAVPARRGRQDGRRLARRTFERAARGADPGRTTPSPITTSRSSTTCRK